MPEYLVVICCACAGARLSNTAVAAAAIMRMRCLPWSRVLRCCFAERYVGANMCVNEPNGAIPLGGVGAGSLMRGLLFHTAYELRRIDESQRDQQPNQGRRHIHHRHRCDRLVLEHAGGE